MMGTNFTLSFEDQSKTDYYWGFNNLWINQSYSIEMSPTPAPTDFNYDYAGCPSYALELSDYTQLKPLINDSQINTINKWNVGTYTYIFNSDPIKSSEWLLSSSTYAIMEATSSLILKLDMNVLNFQCSNPMLTLTDNSQFVSVIFSLVYFYKLFLSTPE